MNFIAALKHAVIGYGIRRRAWGNPGAILMEENGALVWTHLSGYSDREAVLLGDNPTLHLNEADLKATDWTAI